jgi:hypothetical protein
MRHADLVGTGNVRRLALLVAPAADQRPQAGPGADHVLGGDARGGEVVVRDVENVADVLRLARRRVDRAGVVGVGRAENDALAPRYGEEDAAALRHRDRVGDVQPRAVDHEVHALGQPQFHFARRETVRPGACGVDDRPGADFDAFVRQAVEHFDAPDVAVALRELGGRVVDDRGAVRLRGTERVEHEAGVVREAVEVADRAGEALAVELRQDREHFVAP